MVAKSLRLLYLIKGMICVDSSRFGDVGRGRGNLLLFQSLKREHLGLEKSPLVIVF